MLQNIGDKLKTHRWLSLVVLGPLALIFAVWGAYGIASMDFVSSDYALKINGEKIAKTTLNNAWQARQSQYQQYLKGELPAAQKQALQEQLVQEYISRTLLQQRAAQLNLQVGDPEVEAAFRSESAFKVNGQFSVEAARAILAQNGLTASAYESQLREQIRLNQLSNAIEVSDFLTPTETRRLLALENEQREMRYALLHADAFAAGAQLDDAALQSWYDAHHADYQTTETARVQYAELRLDTLAAAVSVTPEALQSWYEKNKDRYGVPERRRASQILFTGGDDAAALAAARKAQAELKAGKDFATAAKAYSQDPASAAKGGDIGWISRDTYASAALKDVGEAIYRLGKVGDLSEPVKTKYGYHLIRLDGIEGGNVKTLDTARAEIEADYRKEQASAVFGERQEQLQQKLEGGAVRDLAALAQQFGLTTGEVAGYTRTGTTELPASAELVRTVFDDADVADGGRVGGPVALSDERLVLVRVQQHSKPQLKPLSEVRAQVLEAARHEAGVKAARAAADAAAKSLQAGGSFDAEVKPLGTTAAPAVFIQRGDAQVPVQIREAVFAAGRPDKQPVYTALSLDDGNAALVQVSAVKAGESAGNAANDKQLAESYRQRLAPLDLAAYLQDLQQRAKIQRNPAALE